MYCRSFSGAEILRCYSTPTDIIPSDASWPSLDQQLDSLLPGCLPLNFVSQVASSQSRIGQIYDCQVAADDTKSSVAYFYLQGKAPSMILNCSTAYRADAHTHSIITALSSCGGKPLSAILIASVPMGYRCHLKKISFRFLVISLLYSSQST